MSPAIEDGPVRVFCGHVLDGLRELPRESVHMVCTSPPFYGLRAYGTTPQVWGGDPDCEHEWGSAMTVHTGGPHGAGGQLAGGGRAVVEAQAAVKNRQVGQHCLRCGCWKGELGLEPIPDCLAWARGQPPCASCWVCHLRMIAAELWRVLRPEGTFWLELGDSYASGAGAVGEQGERWKGSYRGSRPESPKLAVGAMGPMTQPNRMPLPGLKPKDLIGAPWRVALALQADGWYLRSDIIWSKPNPMPESVRDRPTKSHEYLFLLTKAKHYFFDAEAVKETAAYAEPNGAQRSPYGQGFTRRSQAGQDQNGDAQIKGGDRYSGFNSRWDAARAAEGPALSRNSRSVWTISTRPYAAAHFATFPEDLVIPCVQAGTRVCPECGAPWRRLVERRRLLDGHREIKGDFSRPEEPFRIPANGVGHYRYSTKATAIGWQPTCTHDYTPVPATILDPFAGSGTTLAVARRMGRCAVGIELNPTYLDLIKARVGEAALPLLEAIDGQRDGLTLSEASHD